MQYFDMLYQSSIFFSKIFFSTVLVECKPYCLTQTSFKQLLPRHNRLKDLRIFVLHKRADADVGQMECF